MNIDSGGAERQGAGRCGNAVKLLEGVMVSTTGFARVVKTIQQRSQTGDAP